MSDYIEKLLKYCDDVINDKLENRVACQLEKLACKRHLNDLKKSESPDYPFYFDTRAANRRCKFTECLQHTKGKWRGQYIELEPHQVFMEGVGFGWLKKKNKMRRFNRMYFELPRKNGKSAESATTGLYMAFADNELGAEVYAGATTEAQAMMVFQPAWQMVKMNEDFREHFGVELSGTPKNPTSVYNLEDMSKFIPVVGKPGDGSSPHCAIVDEYHEHPTPVLYDAMDTGMGARSQPVLLVITTAGVNTAAPCYDLHSEAVKVLEGTIENDALFCMIFTIDKDDDWQDFECWKKANPNYKISIDEDYLYGKYKDALNKPSQRNILLTKHLNIWQNAGVAWMDMLKWKQCEDLELTIDLFQNYECWVALDLASKIDLCAVVYAFKHTKRVVNVTCPVCFEDAIVEGNLNKCTSCEWEKPVTRQCVAFFARHYLPEDTVNKTENQHYQKWVQEGYLTSTEGARTDFSRVERDIEQAAKDFSVKELAFDPKEASYLIQNIEEWANFECIEFPQGPSLISEPMKELEARVYAGELVHPGDPIFTWCMGNVIKKQSRSGGSVKHYFPTKENDKLKIDSAVAAIMALARLMTYEDGTVYDERAAREKGAILRTL